jgi:hypothetical protein
VALTGQAFEVTTIGFDGHPLLHGHRAGKGSRRGAKCHHDAVTEVLDPFPPDWAIA